MTFSPVDGTYDGVLYYEEIEMTNGDETITFNDSISGTFTISTTPLPSTTLKLSPELRLDIINGRQTRFNRFSDILIKTGLMRLYLELSFSNNYSVIERSGSNPNLCYFEGTIISDKVSVIINDLYPDSRQKYIIKGKKRI